MKVPSVVGGCLGLLVLSACLGSTASMPPQDVRAATHTGSGMGAAVRGALTSMRAAAGLVTTNLRAWMTEGERRVQDLLEGMEKVREGKEQIEQGLRGE